MLGKTGEDDYKKIYQNIVYGDNYMCSKNEISNRNVIVEISSTERNEFTNNIKGWIQQESSNQENQEE